MAKLQVPIGQYTSGSKPTHTSTVKLGTIFKDINQETLLVILETAGLVKNGKPTRKSIEEEYADTCQKFILWNIEKIEELLKTAGLTPTRIPANQELPKETSMVSLTTIASYFDVSGVVVGKWLKELGLRDEKGVPLKKILRENKAEKISYKDGGQSRTFYKWDLVWTLKKLQEAGHIFEFNFEKSLKGKGNDGDVKVTTIQDRARETAKQFAKLYNDIKTREESYYLIEKQPRMVVEEIEKILKKPGWITTGKYKKR